MPRNENTMDLISRPQTIRFGAEARPAYEGGWGRWNGRVSNQISQSAGRSWGPISHQRDRSSHCAMSAVPPKADPRPAHYEITQTLSVMPAVTTSPRTLIKKLYFLHKSAGSVFPRWERINLKVPVSKPGDRYELDLHIDSPRPWRDMASDHSYL